MSTKNSLLLFFVLVLNQPASADIIFFVNDNAGFNAATNPMIFLGSEDFESSTLSTGEVAGVNDPLTGGVANGPFASGINSNLGLSIQSNVLAGNATTTAPFGISGLATYADGFGFSPSDQLTTQFMTHSLDLIFDLNTSAVEFSPLFVHGSSNPNLVGPITVDVYDQNNVFLDSLVVPDVSFFLVDKTVGIVANGGDEIGRVNLYDENNTQHWQGVDDIGAYSVPEPNLSMVGFIAILSTMLRSPRRNNFR